MLALEYSHGTHRCTLVRHDGPAAAMFAVLFLLVVWGVVASAGLQGYEWIGLGVLSIALTWVLTAVLHLTALTRARFADVRKHVTWRMLSDADARCGHIALKSSNTPGAYGVSAAHGPRTSAHSPVRRKSHYTIQGVARLICVHTDTK